MAILTPNPSRLMESLRDTGYSFNTAMADIVDNSIAAGATLVSVKVEFDFDNNLHVYIIDNGCGMNKEGLLNAMTYGSQERPIAASLGKFGMGLKTASTAFCRSLSVISKDNSSEYNKVQWDLDHVCQTQTWELIETIPDDDEIDLLEEVTEGGSGTLVVWDKVDRLMKEYVQEASRDKAFKKLIDSLQFHFSMTYQRFLDPKFEDVDNVKIILNDIEVQPWDPFCVGETETKLLSDKPLGVLINGEKVYCKLEAWVLPINVMFSTDEAYKNARVSNDMEGFYIYRENRLIHWGDWLGTYVNDPHFALLRINLSFDHKFDDVFNIDIKKSRILLDDNVFEFFKKKYLPALRKVANDIYRGQQSKESKKKSEGAHVGANRNIKNHTAETVNSEVKVTPGSDEVEVVNSAGGYKTTEISVLPMQNPGETHIVVCDDMDDLLWKPSLINGEHAVSISSSHDFYTKVYLPILKQSNVVMGVDSLLWALAEAEMTTCNELSKRQFKNLRYEVSSILTELLQDLPEPGNPDE